MKKIIEKRNKAGLELYNLLKDFSDTSLNEWDDDNNLVKIFIHEFMIYLSGHLLWKIDPPDENDFSIVDIPYLTKSFIDNPKILKGEKSFFKLRLKKRNLKGIIYNFLFFVNSLLLERKKPRKILEISESAELCVPLIDFAYAAKKL